MKELSMKEMEQVGGGIWSLAARHAIKTAATAITVYVNRDTIKRVLNDIGERAKKTRAPNR